ncbi:hypothetical protein EH203_04500 [Pectobacterium carotovorum subsp. carotovorum]|nr:hypothetical protein EH203_04500 [Pectobacterium carotovorum subsp. carotovorum]
MRSVCGVNLRTQQGGSQGGGPKCGVTHHDSLCFYTRHTSSCMCVGCAQSPESLTYVSSSGLLPLPPT